MPGSRSGCAVVPGPALLRICSPGVITARGAHLAEAQRLGRTGSFAWNVRRREYVYWSAELYRIFGRDPTEGLPSFQSALDQFHPEDWSRVFEARQKAIREKTDYNYEIRLVTPNGDFKHLRVAGHPIVDDAGDVSIRPRYGSPMRA